MQKLTEKARMIDPMVTMGLKVEAAAISRVTANAQQHTDQAAEQTQRDGLDQELDADVPGLGADRDADADLTGPLGDTDQHDVHDADTAHDQGQPGDRAQQQRQGRGHVYSPYWRFPAD